MLVIGLTGGIGSGKTTVAQLFAERNVSIIDADSIARIVTQPDKPAFLDIIDHFEEPLLLENGTLDRAKLRTIIFNHPEERRWLENLLHPLIRNEIQQQLKILSSPYCIIVIPLLFETGMESYSFIQRILVVDTPEHLQIERTAKRDKSDKAHIEAILKSQASRDHRLTKAHDIIVNTGTLNELIPQVQQLHEMYLNICKNKH